MRAVPGIPSPSKKPSLVISSWVAGEEELGCCSACSSEDKKKGEEGEICSVWTEKTRSLHWVAHTGPCCLPCPPQLCFEMLCCTLQQLLMCCRPVEGEERRRERERVWRGLWLLSVCMCVSVCIRVDDGFLKESEFMWMSGIVETAETLCARVCMLATCLECQFPGLSGCLQLSFIEPLNINEWTVFLENCFRETTCNLVSTHPLLYIKPKNNKVHKKKRCLIMIQMCSMQMWTSQFNEVKALSQSWQTVWWWGERHWESKIQKLIIQLSVSTFSSSLSFSPLLSVFHSY